MSFESHFDSEADLRRYEALLEVADLMVHHHSLPELFVDLAKRLHKVTPFEFATFSLYDPNKNVMKLHIWEGRELAPIPAEAAGRRLPSRLGLATPGTAGVVGLAIRYTFSARFEFPQGKRNSVLLHFAAHYRSKTLGRSGIGQYPSGCLPRKGFEITSPSR